MATIHKLDPRPEEPESEDKFRALWEAAPDAMVIVGKDGRITLVNRQAERMFAYPRQELLGQEIELLVPERFRAAYALSRQAYFIDPAIRPAGATVDLLGRRKDGSEFPVEITLSPLVSAQETLVISAIRNMTERKQVSESLRRSEEKFRLLVERVKDYAIFMLDPKGTIVTWNAGAQNIKSYRAEEIIGRHFSCFYPVEDRDTGKLDGELQTALAEGRYQDEGWRLRKDGTRFWASVLITAVHDEAGQFRGFANITRDLSESRKADDALRQSEERMRRIIDTAYDAFLSMDRHGKVIAWNLQAEVIFGWRRDEVLGRTLAETIIPHRYRETHSRGLQQFLATGEGPVLNKRLQLSALHRDGHEFPVELTITPLLQEGTQTFNAFVHDITHRKRAEQKLKAFAADLKRSNRELQEFASVASHDLQEPLRKIQTFGDRLQTKCGEALNAEGRDALARMQNAAGRMRALISDLLEFSRVGAKPARFAPVNLTQVAHEVVSDLEGSLHATGGRVEIGALPILDGEPLQMRQLVQNLIGNALKFHRPDAPPVVKIQGQLLSSGAPAGDPGVASANAFYQITVADNGIGIDAPNLERIFGVFQRLHARNEYAGTGIGLAICRKIVEGHGGSITASSQPGHGAIFTVLLPAYQTQGAPDEELPKTHYDPDGR